MIRCLLYALILTFAAPALAQESLMTPVPGGIEATDGTKRIRVTAITDSILRVRIARGDKFAEDASWAVGREMRRKSVAVQPMANGFRTAALAVKLDPTTLQLTVSDPAGHVISQDAAPLAFDGRGFVMRKALPIDE